MCSLQFIVQSTIAATWAFWQPRYSKMGFWVALITIVLLIIVGLATGFDDVKEELIVAVVTLFAIMLVIGITIGWNFIRSLRSDFRIRRLFDERHPQESGYLDAIRESKIYNKKIIGTIERVSKITRPAIKRLLEDTPQSVRSLRVYRKEGEHILAQADKLQRRLNKIESYSRKHLEGVIWIADGHSTLGALERFTVTDLIEADEMKAHAERVLPVLIRAVEASRVQESINIERTYTLGHQHLIQAFETLIRIVTRLHEGAVYALEHEKSDNDNPPANSSES